MKKSNDENSINQPVLYLSYDKEKIENKIISAHKKYVAQNRLRMNGEITYFLVDNKFLDLIEYYRNDEKVNFRGLKSEILRTSLEEFKDYIMNLKNNYEHSNFSSKRTVKRFAEYPMMKNSGGIRKETSSYNKRKGLNVKIPPELTEFITNLSEEYDSADDFKKVPDDSSSDKSGWGYSSFIMNESLYFFFTGKLMYM